MDAVVFRAGPQDGPAQCILSAARLAAGLGTRAIVHVELGGADHAVANEDDDAIARRVRESAEAALSGRGALVFFDPFQDRDRGYYPCHGIVDRRGNPHPAWHALRELWLARARR